MESPSKELMSQLVPEGIFPQPNLPGSIQTTETEATRYGYGNLINLMRNVKSQFYPNSPNLLRLEPVDSTSVRSKANPCRPPLTRSAGTTLPVFINL